MPLFQDPDRRQQDLVSEEYGEREPSPSRNQPYVAGHGGFRSLGTIGATPRPAQPTRSNLPKLWTNDRGELIQRIKESSSWRLRRVSQDIHSNDVYMPHHPPGSPVTEGVAEEHASEHQYHGTETDTEELGSPADIQRPRSALHSGDFREGAAQHDQQPPQPLFTERSPASPSARLSSSPTTPWFSTSAFPASIRRTNTLKNEPEIAVTRSRTPSLGSFSSSYVLKVPTSPLVHQANNTDLDFSPRTGPTEVSEPLDTANRRRTLPPETFRSLQSSPSESQAVNLRSPCPPRRRDEFFAHQPYSPPRRSLTSSYSLQLASSVQSPAPRARRPSFASDISSKPHASLVGSYEESILRGRMSMNPSKPLDFTAQIGVLGKGKCKAHLKCPPHVTVPFPAVFYSYPTSGSGRSISDDNPSPYVGQIDLENSLTRDDPNSGRRRRRRGSPGGATKEHAKEQGVAQPPDADTLRRREKRNRRAESPKCPPGGSYRIPQQGQLQIMIKNPHKTAVKLFLVPYDLSDMEPGTKTFIRQRSYSAGAVIDMPLSARKNYGTDRPEASLNVTEDPNDKPILRYLVHLNICCPARGRFYLHSSIRVVFANRVPDGKEKLRNEIQLPEPRYSPYKPARESTPGTASARLAIEKASRRRSAGQGMIPLLRPHVPSPSEISLQWDTASPMNFAGPSQNIPHSPGCNVYNKLNKGDLGYGGYPFTSNQGRSEVGESLLAKRLRGLDVHKHESCNNE